MGGNPHLLFGCLAMPGRQSMKYLTGIEGRRGDPIVGNLETRKAAVRQLDGQQESYCLVGTFPKTALRQCLAQGEESRDDIARCFRVGGGPPAIELVPTSNAAVRLGILRLRQPLCRRPQMLVLGKPAACVA